MQIELIIKLRLDQRVCIELTEPSEKMKEAIADFVKALEEFEKFQYEEGLSDRT